MGVVHPYAEVRLRSIVMSISVCLSVRSHTSKTTRPNVKHFICMTRSSFGGVVIRYVLPVSWMTSCSHTVGSTGQNQALRCVYEFARWRYEFDVRQLYVWSSSSECGTRDEVRYLRLTLRTIYYDGRSAWQFCAFYLSHCYSIAWDRL